MATRGAVDAIILGGTKHSWGLVRGQSVLAVERMTGRTWFKHQKNESPEWHVEEVREWWEANRDSFTLPDPAAAEANTDAGQGSL